MCVFPGCTFFKKKISKGPKEQKKLKPYAMGFHHQGSYCNNEAQLIPLAP